MKTPDLLLRTTEGVDVVNVSVQITTPAGQARKSFWIPAVDMAHVADAITGVLDVHAVVADQGKPFMTEGLGDAQL